MFRVVYIQSDRVAVVFAGYSLGRSAELLRLSDACLVGVIREIDGFFNPYEREKSSHDGRFE